MTCEMCSCGAAIHFNCVKDATAICNDCGKEYTVGCGGKLERTALEILGASCHQE